MGGDQDERIGETERAALLVDIARDLQDSGALPRDRIVLREARIAYAVHAYFVLNDAYHRWRIEDGHNTQPAKIAALQCLCIIRFVPFRLLEPDNAETVAEAKCNEIFCMAIAAALLGIEIRELTTEKRDQYLRILDLLTAFECETIEPVIQATNYQIKRERNEYNLAILEADKPKIDAIITIFELLMENFRMLSASSGGTTSES